MADGSVKIDIEADDSDFKKKIDGVGDTAEDAAGGVEDLGDAVEESSEQMGLAEIAAGNFISNALSNLIAKVGEAITAILGLAESTREYREDMAKLDAAFETTGGSTEMAKQAYMDFYAILGESDRSVEAVNHLAELCNTEEELADWSTICAGVTAKFGDSLPIEGLTEAANETAKVGEVTGPLADALNWAGISEDAFNEALAACNDEQERSTLITSTLTGLYSDAADKYNELTSSEQEARRASAELEAAQAALGEAVEPLTTAMTEMRTRALETLLPVIEKVVGAFEKYQQFMEEHPKIATAVKAVVTGLAVALIVLVAVLSSMMIVKMVTTAMEALNLVMLMNPIFLVIAAIVALVAVFVYLWKHCEGFRNFWIALWDGIVLVVTTVVDAFRTFFTETIPGFFDACIEAVTNFFTAIWKGLTNFFTAIWSFLTEQIPAIVESVVAWIAELPGRIWEWLVNVVTKVAEWVKNMIDKANEAGTGFVESLIVFIATLPVRLWEWLLAAITKAQEFVLGLGQKGLEAAEALLRSLIDGAAAIPEKMLTIGKNIVDGVWQGIVDAKDAFFNKIKDFFGSMVNTALEALGIRSPSRVFAYVGEMSAAGLGVGWQDEIATVEKTMADDLVGMSNRLRATVGVEGGKTGMTRGTDGVYDIARAVGMQTAGISSLATEYRKGAGSSRPVVIELNGRELGRAVVDLGGAEETRLGARLAYGGA